jgi:GT2 family glycosyltransferase
MRVDSAGRVENLRASLRFIGRHAPGAEVIVVESGAAPGIEDVAAAAGARYLFVEQPERFSKSNTVNAGVLAATRRFVAIYDADVLLDPQALPTALRLMRYGGIRAVIPFNWIFADVSGDLARQIADSLEVGPVGRIRNERSAPTRAGLDVRLVKGGVLLVDRDVLRLEGGLNRKLISYGWSDTEVAHRLTRLGYRVYSLRRFSCVHLEHERGPDSQQNERYELNGAEFRKVAAMGKAELRRYVDTELDIAGPAAQPERDALRRRQRLVNALTLQPLTYPLNQLAVAAQVYGAGRLGRQTALRLRLRRR